jgi:glutamyl-tRNA reductase
VVPVLKALRARFLDVARAEAERNGARLAPPQLAEAIVNKLLHAPLTALKRRAGEGDDALLAAAVRELFDLTVEEEGGEVVPLKREGS